METPPEAQEGLDMRTLRLSLAGTVIFMLLGGPGGIVLAQEDEALDPMAPASFTGTVVAWDAGDRSIEVLPDRTIERWIAEFENTMTDPRVSGLGETLDYLESIEAADGRVFLSHAGYGRLTNDGGSFALECTGAGTLEAAMEGAIACWYVGEAGYEGLTAFMLLTMRPDGDFDAEGWICPGGPPPEHEYEPEVVVPE
jgi:hypothetical protein